MSEEEQKPAEEEQKPLDYISEVVLKKRKNNEQWAIRRKEQLEQRTKKHKKDNFAIKKPEQFIREFRDREMDLLQMKSRVKLGRRGRSAGTSSSKFLFVIRIGGKNDMHPQSRKILHSLRLRKIFNGVFVKLNSGIMEILRKVEPYVTYGYPNVKNVKDLIYKKGVGKLNKQRVPLTDNNIIEQALSKYNVICLEDIVNEIVNVGPNFKEVCSFLCPFSLTKPEKALQGKRKRFLDGGDSGNREDKINELLEVMN